jgi:outer membrane protein assembly factor BamB
MLPRSVWLPGLVAWGVFASDSNGTDWPQWLGPDRDGRWKETGLVDTFPTDGPKVLWKKSISAGYSGPAVAGGKVYVCDRQGDAPTGERTPKDGLPGKERVLCYDFKTGDTVWEHSYDCPYSGVNFPSGPRTTPVVDGDRVFTLGAMGDLLCLDAKTGKPVWEKHFKIDYSVKPPVWGWSSHLLADKERVYSLVGGEGSCVVAFDKTSGKEIWKALTSKEVGYSPPVMVEAAGVTQLIVWLSDVVAGLNPKTGEVYWKEKHPAGGVKHPQPAVTISTPCVKDNVVYVSSAYDGGLALKLATDKPAASVVWRSSQSFPKDADKLPTLMSSIIAKGEHLYVVEPNACEVVCAKADTGENVWTSRNLFKGQQALHGGVFWVSAEGREYCLTDQGDLVILDLNPKGYKELGRAHVIDPTQGARGRKVVWSHPAFADKCMVARNDKEIVCVSLAKD